MHDYTTPTAELQSTRAVFYGQVAPKKSPPPAAGPTGTGLDFGFYFARAWQRKVTTWARVQVDLGAKVVGVAPVVTPFSTAQRTAL